MTNKAPKTISLIIQGIYSLCCLFHIIVSFIYNEFYDTEVGRLCADITLHLIFVLFLSVIPAMLISNVLNICARSRKKENNSRSGFWTFWIIISPILYIVFFVLTLGVWISVTGGI